MYILHKYSDKIVAYSAWPIVINFADSHFLNDNFAFVCIDTPILIATITHKSKCKTQFLKTDWESQACVAPGKVFQSALACGKKDIESVSCDIEFLAVKTVIAT